MLFQAVKAILKAKVGQTQHYQGVPNKVLGEYVVCTFKGGCVTVLV